MTIEQTLDRWVTTCAALAAGLATASLGGWILGASAWYGGFPGLYLMTPNTALGLVLAAAALVLVAGRRPDAVRLTGKILGLGVALIAATKPLQSGHWGLDLMFDLDRAGISAATSVTVLHATLPLIGTGLGLAALLLPRRPTFNLSNWLGLAVANLSLFSVVGRLLAPPLAEVGPPSGAILGCLALGIGLACVRAEAEFSWFPAPGNPRRPLALRMLAIGLLVPLGLYAVEVRWLLPLAPQLLSLITLVAVAFDLAMLATFTYAVRNVQLTDRRRRDAESSRDLLLARIQQQAADLEMQVAERTRTLDQTNQRLQLALRSSNFGVWDRDIATGRQVWDERQHSLYGLKPGGFDGTYDSWLAFVHPEDRPRVGRIDAGMQQNPDGIDYEFRIIRGDGAVRQIEAHATLQLAPNGRPVRLVGINRDVTAERAQATALSTLNERLQFVLNASGFGVWDFTFEGGRLGWDDHILEIFSLTKETVRPESSFWKPLIHPDDLAMLQTRVIEVMGGQQNQLTHRFRVIRTDGAVRHLEIHAYLLRHADRRPLRLVGIATDVTVRKQMEEQLRHSEELSLQLGRLAQIGGWEWDIVNSRLTWSPEMYRIHEVPLGYEPTLAKELEFFAPQPQAAYSDALSTAVRTGKNFDLELPFRTARGNQLFVRILGHADVRDGRPVRIYGAFQDITARRDAEEMRRQLEAQLFQAQKMETLGTLAGGIAHDFNNLLTGILGYQDLALETLPPDSPALGQLAAARDASMHARELVDQILTFSRQAGSEKTPVDLGKIVEDSRRFLRASVPSSIRIECDIAPDCPPVRADVTQLHQVLLNLGTNSAHAMQASGGIMRIVARPVTLEGEAAARRQLSPGAYVEILFSDTGHGMDEEVRQRIFDPFFTTKETGQGTGLGLSAVHGIIEAHHGAIEAASEMNVGTTFTIHFPAAVEEEAAPEETPAAIVRGNQELIAVVDDEDMVRAFVQMALEHSGYRVRAFDSAALCLESLRKKPGEFSLLLTDQTMPMMKGLELAEAVRQFDPHLPVMIMSGYFSRISPDKLARIGHVSMIAKPFTNAEIAQAVHRAMNGQPGGSDQ
jgi:PAS domain S-box-containing protein